MYSYFIYTLLCLEGIAACVGLYFSSKYPSKTNKPFAYYLISIFLLEVSTRILVINNLMHTASNLIEYAAIPLEFVFLYWFIIQLSQYTEKAKIFLMASLTYLMSFIIETFFKATFEFLNISYTVGNLFLLILVLKCMYDFMNSNDILKFLYSPIFYICIGLLLFYLGTFPFYAIKNVLWAEFKTIGLKYWYTAMALNCIMYCMFTISFLCHKQKSISP